MADDPQEINRTLTDADILIYDSGGFLAFDQLKISDAKKLAWVHATSAGVTDFAKILTKTKIQNTYRKYYILQSESHLKSSLSLYSSYLLLLTSRFSW